MVSYIRGEVLFCTETSVVIDAGSVGIEVSVTARTLEAMELSIGGVVEMYTYLHVKEDALTLYGFNTRKELRLFKMLITVSGIGPKSALGILSQIAPDELIGAILSEDSASIAKTPGVGAKSAGKIVLELKDRLTFEDMLDIGNTDGILHKKRKDAAGADTGEDRDNPGKESKDQAADASGKRIRSKAKDGSGEPEGDKKDRANDLQNSKNEAIQALSALGYSVSEAMKAVRSVEPEAGMSTEEILKLSLKYL